MRISDWSSDVCSSDLQRRGTGADAGTALVERDRQADDRAPRVRFLLDHAHDPGLLGGDEFRHVVDRRYRHADLLEPAHPLIAAGGRQHLLDGGDRSEEHTSELQSLMRISYAVFCLKKKNKSTTQPTDPYHTH